jgi:hypothetical protein
VPALGNAAQRIQAEFGLWTYYVVRGDYARAVELADDLLTIARQQSVRGTLVPGLLLQRVLALSGG